MYAVVHRYIGKEAVVAGICSNLNRDDQIISTRLGLGHWHCRRGRSENG